MTRPLEEENITNGAYGPNTAPAKNDSGDDHSEVAGDDHSEVAGDDGVSARDETQKTRNWSAEKEEEMALEETGSLISNDYLLREMKALAVKIDLLENKNTNLESEISGIKYGHHERKIEPGGIDVIRNDVPWADLGEGIEEFEDEIQSPVGRASTLRKFLKRKTTLRRLTDQENNEELKLEQDVYSFLLCYRWNTSPFAFAFVITVGLQLTLVVLLLNNLIKPHDKENPFAVPANVVWPVRIAQMMSLFIAVFSQDDIRLGIEGVMTGIPPRYKGSRDFSQMTSTQWYFAYTLRTLIGFSTLLGTFVLVVQADNVFDLFLNFSGIEFISQMDNIIFIVALRGYFGKSLEVSAQKVIDASFSIRNKSKYWYCLSRTKRRMIGLTLILGTSFATYAYLLIRQLNGAYLVKYIEVEFGDHVFSYLGTYSGCYEKLDSEFDSNDRATYRQVVDHEYDTGFFGYCSTDDFEGWIFFTGNNPCDEDSNRENLLVKSEEEDSYDIMDSSASDWFTSLGEPLDYIRMVKSSKGTSHCQDILFTELMLCRNLTLDASSEGFQGTRIWSREHDLLFTEDRNVLYYRQHPVFVGKSEGMEGYDVLFFAGQRWILTDSSSLFSAADGISKGGGEPNNSTDVAFLFENPYFNILDLPIGTFYFISEWVESTGDIGTPLGLQWYHTRYSLSQFPFVDYSKASDVLFQCGECNNLTNPCQHDGVCLDGICSCIDDTSGKLCDIKPLGDGVCHDRFNTLEDNYDGGDCCGSTCEGAFCGMSGPSTPFGYDIEDPTISFIRGAYTGFVNCQDPEVITMKIQFVLDGVLDGKDVEPDSFCDIDSIDLQCDGKTYLTTPFLAFGDRFDNSNNCFDTYTDFVFVPFGSTCELTRKKREVDMPASRYRTTLYVGDSLIPIRDEDENVTSIEWVVPQQCLTAFFKAYSELTLSETAPSTSVIEDFTTDGISESLCLESYDLVKERYALSLLNTSVAIDSTEKDVHQCYGWGSPAVKMTCKESKVYFLELDSESTKQRGTLPSEMSYLSSLNILRLHTPDITGTLPSEIGTLTSLRDLHLKSNSLEGTIPLELGKLINLELLSLRDNNFTGTVPLEIFQLTALKSLSLGSNSFIGTFPTEIGQLVNLETLLIQDNDFTGPIPSELSKLSKLRSCYMGGNLFTSESTKTTPEICITF